MDTSMDDDARIAQLLEQVAAGLADNPLNGKLNPIVPERDGVRHQVGRSGFPRVCAPFRSFRVLRLSNLRRAVFDQVPQHAWTLIQHIPAGEHRSAP